MSQNFHYHCYSPTGHKTRQTKGFFILGRTYANRPPLLTDAFVFVGLYSRFLHIFQLLDYRMDQKVMKNEGFVELGFEYA